MDVSNKTFLSRGVRNQTRINVVNQMLMCLHSEVEREIRCLCLSLSRSLDGALSANACVTFDLEWQSGGQLPLPCVPRGYLNHIDVLSVQACSLPPNLSVLAGAFSLQVVAITCAHKPRRQNVIALFIKHTHTRIFISIVHLSVRLIVYCG